MREAHPPKHMMQMICDMNGPCKMHIYMWYQTQAQKGQKSTKLTSPLNTCTRAKEHTKLTLNTCARAKITPSSQAPLSTCTRAKDHTKLTLNACERAKSTKKPSGFQKHKREGKLTMHVYKGFQKPFKAVWRTILSWSLHGPRSSTIELMFSNRVSIPTHKGIKKTEPWIPKG
jgi:hypothetical protein